MTTYYIGVFEEDIQPKTWSNVAVVAEGWYMDDLINIEIVAGSTSVGVWGRSIGTGLIA